MPNNKRQQQQHLESPHDDHVERAPESGDPEETGRSHGKPVDEQPEHDDPGKQNGDDWESGRHRAS